MKQMTIENITKLLEDARICGVAKERIVTQSGIYKITIAFKGSLIIEIDSDNGKDKICKSIDTQDKSLHDLSVSALLFLTWYFKKKVSESYRVGSEKLESLRGSSTPKSF